MSTIDRWLSHTATTTDRWLSYRVSTTDTWLSYRVSTIDRWLSHTATTTDRWLSYRVSTIDRWLPYPVISLDRFPFVIHSIKLHTHTCVWVGDKHLPRLHSVFACENTFFCVQYNENSHFACLLPPHTSTHCEKWRQYNCYSRSSQDIQAVIEMHKRPTMQPCTSHKLLTTSHLSCREVSMRAHAAKPFKLNTKSFNTRFWL